MSEAMMDFNDSPEQANYRMQCRSWLAEALTDFDGRRPHFPDFDVPEVMAAARAWQSRKALAGYAAISSPRGYGGGGGSRIEQEIFDQEERASPAPFTDVFDIGLGMALPTMAAFATPEQKSALLPPLIAGRDIWCQLFSEPSCGSDLAAVRTRAIRDGTDWILDGQKIWTSYAQHADYGLILTRSNPDVPKHKGLTCFFIDMRAPGVEVRPIVQMAGIAEYNEVFFTGVRVPDAQRLGEVDGGWSVALSTLMHERTLGGAGKVRGLTIADIIEGARKLQIGDVPALADGAVRERIADWWIDMEGIRLNYYRALTLLTRGETPGPEFSAGKLMSGRQVQEMAAFMLDLSGPSAIDIGDDSDSAGLAMEWLMAARRRLAGGADEIMKNILAERVLGLPVEPRLDKDIPFRDLF